MEICHTYVSKKRISATITKLSKQSQLEDKIGIECLSLLDLVSQHKMLAKIANSTNNIYELQWPHTTFAIPISSVAIGKGHYVRHHDLCAKYASMGAKYLLCWALGA